MLIWDGGKQVFIYVLYQPNEVIVLFGYAAILKGAIGRLQPFRKRVAKVGCQRLGCVDYFKTDTGSRTNIYEGV